jgi:circadian clock protein KaiC
MELGTSALLLGPAGTGKSSIVAQYVHSALKRNERVAIFSFDENAHTFFARTSSMGMDFRGPQRDGQLLLKQVDPAELAPGEFVHAVRRAVEEQGTRIVVIDSLNGYLMAMPDEKFLVVQMHELLSYLSQKGVMTLLVMAQHGLLGNMSTPIDVTYLSDTVILFRFFESDGKVRKAISVLKKRVGEHEDSIREFQVSSKGVRLGAPLSEFRGVLSGTPVFSGRTETLLSEPKKT